MLCSSSSRRSRSSRGLLLGAVMVVLALLVAGVAGESADLYAVQCAKVRTTVGGGVDVLMQWVGLCVAGCRGTVVEFSAEYSIDSSMGAGRNVDVGNALGQGCALLCPSSIIDSTNRPTDTNAAHRTQPGVRQGAQGGQRGDRGAQGRSGGREAHLGLRGQGRRHLQHGACVCVYVYVHMWVGGERPSNRNQSCGVGRSTRLSS